MSCGENIVELYFFDQKQLEGLHLILSVSPNKQTAPPSILICTAVKFHHTHRKRLETVHLNLKQSQILLSHHNFESAFDISFPK